MSFYEFDQGMTSEEIQRRRAAGISGKSPGQILIEERDAANAKLAMDQGKAMIKGLLNLEIKILKVQGKKFPMLASAIREKIKAKQAELDGNVSPKKIDTI